MFCVIEAIIVVFTLVKDFTYSEIHTLICRSSSQQFYKTGISGNISGVRALTRVDDCLVLNLCQHLD